MPLNPINQPTKTDKGHTFPFFLSMLLHTKQRKDTHFRSSYRCCYTQNKEKTHISALLIDAAIHKTKKRHTFQLFLSMLLYTKQRKDTHFRSSYRCCYTQNKEKTHISTLLIDAATHKTKKRHTFPLFFVKTFLKESSFTERRATVCYSNYRVLDNKVFFGSPTWRVTERDRAVLISIG